MELLPSAETAVAPLEKLRDYSLDAEHPVGKHKARVFASALGFSKTDAGRLREMIMRAVMTSPVIDRGENVHGNRYAVDFQAFGKKGAVTIRTAWIIDHGENTPRLTSCYVRGKRNEG